ncbi:MAG: hypothetical protein QXG03_03100, partial [Halalkalicoccus sp.]
RNRVRDALADDEQFAYQKERFEKRFRGESIAWSKPWRFAITIDNGLSVIPAKNLVSNVGFDERAIHTTDPESDLADLPRYELAPPFEGPPTFVPDRRYQRAYFERFERTGRVEAIREAGVQRAKELAVFVLPEGLKDALKRRLEG